MKVLYTDQGSGMNIRYYWYRVEDWDFQKELLEIQKSFRLKLRRAPNENVLVAFDGIVDDADVHNWPAPLKLTSKGLQILKDFRLMSYYDANNV